ncbi:MAG: electron transport complex subunit RsxC [Eubacteriales bacterium]
MKLSFKGGIHPLSSIHHGKYLTDKCALETMPAPKILSFPISQHIGAPAKPIVSVGDRVLVGQKIAEAAAFVSVPVHSSVSGTVTEIAEKPHILGRPVLSIVVENDFKDEKVPGYGETRDISKLDKKEKVGLIQEGGIVGMGGATFPTHVKLSPPDDKPIEYVIVNAAECEPFLTADHRALLEKTDEIIKGLQIVMDILGVKNGIVGIENNKKDAIAVMKKAVKDLPITIKTLKVKYPQGGEKQLIQAITKREVPSGGLPMDIGVVVLNTSTCIAIYQALVKQIPLTERIVTVTGIVKKPSNLVVRVGASFGDVCEYVGGFTEAVEKLITGGPMMGIAQYSLDVSVIKGTSGILALGKKLATFPAQVNCIRCTHCVTACPAGLLPLTMNQYILRADYEMAEKYNVMDCIECGACSYICPSNRYLTQSFKLGKMQITKRKKAQSAK